VNPANRGERYMVVYSNPHSAETHRIKSYTPVVIPIGAIAVQIDGREAGHSLPNAAVGTLTLTVTPYEPAVVSK